MKQIKMWLVIFVSILALLIMVNLVLDGLRWIVVHWNWGMTLAVAWSAVTATIVTYAVFRDAKKNNTKTALLIILALIASTALAERITFSPSQPASQVHHYRVYASPHSTTNPAAVWTFNGSFTNPPTVLVTNILTRAVTNRLLIQTNLPLGTISGKVSVVGTNGFESASAKEEILFPVSNLTIEVE